MLGEKSIHRKMNVDYIPALRSLVHKPCGIFIERLVVAFKRSAIFRAAGRQCFSFQRQGIKGGRRQMDYFCASLICPLSQTNNPVLERAESLFAERVINAIVHPVARED